MLKLVSKMDNPFFLYIYFNGVMLEIVVACIFESRQQIEMRFNKNVTINDMKENI